MQQIAVPQAASGERRWWVLATVVAAQFMFGVDAFIVNVALPTIARDLQASSAQVEAIVAIYLIGYATLVVTGGRLGDIYGTKATFIGGVAGFTLTSLWCGLAQSGPELIIARLAQGATAALMVPQVLATLHVLFPDSARGRAFAVYGTVLGLAGAAGFLLGGLLVTLNAGGLGWRGVFFVNVPVGAVIIAAAVALVPSVSRPARTRLDLPGAAILFLGLLCVIGPLLFGRDLGWQPAVWLTMAIGAAILALFLRFERRVAERGGMPLVDLALLTDRRFMRGLGAVFFFFCGNLSFYLVMTLFMQQVLHYSPLQAGTAVLPLALAFVVATRHSAARAGRRGTLVLIEGCLVQIAALTLVGLTIGALGTPAPLVLMVPLTAIGYGQGMVMAPISSVVLSTVAPTSAGAASGLYGTTTQIANAAGVAVIGAVYFAAHASGSDHLALFAALGCVTIAIALSITFLTWMRRA